MKKITLFNLIAILIGSIVFLGCEKNNEISYQNTKSTNKTSYNEVTFINPEFVLVDENHKDCFGNIGKLYINKNNDTEKYFEVTLMQKANCPSSLTGGTLSTTRDSQGRIIKMSCSGASKDCFSYVVWDEECRPRESTIIVRLIF